MQPTYAECLEYIHQEMARVEEGTPEQQALQLLLDILPLAEECGWQKTLEGAQRYAHTLEQAVGFFLLGARGGWETEIALKVLRYREVHDAKKHAWKDDSMLSEEVALCASLIRLGVVLEEIEKVL